MGDPREHRLCWRANRSWKRIPPKQATGLGRSQEGKVRVSLFPPRGGQSKGTRDGTGRSRQPRAQPGLVAFPGGSEGVGGPGKAQPAAHGASPARSCPGLSQFAGKRFHLVGTSCSPAPCSQQGGGGAHSPTSPAQGSSRGPPAPGPCHPAPCSSPTPAGAGRAGAPLLIYSTPLEHALDPNGAPGTAARAGLREPSRGSGAGTWNSRPARGAPAWHTTPEPAGEGNPEGCDPCQVRCSAGCQGGKAQPQPRPWLQGKAWRAEPGSYARKRGKKAGKPRKTERQEEEDERRLS